MNAPITLIDDDSGKIQLYPDWLENSGIVFDHIKDRINWQSREIQLYGRTHPIPRKESWNAEAGVRYAYSGEQYIGSGWDSYIASMVKQIEADFNWQPNGALLNLYRDGSDKMGWHSDDEPELGRQPNVAIVSLGAPRDFALKRIGTTRTALTVKLLPGSLLWMTGNTQHEWQHSLPKRAVAGERISCTFRRIVEAY